MSDTNRVSLGYVEESTAGSVPASPAWQTMCITGAPNLAATPQTVVSNKIRSDRQISDLILTGTEAGGDVPGELAFSVSDGLLEGAFFNTFQSRIARVNNAGATEITGVDDVNDEFDVTSTTVTVVNDIVRAEGFGVAANNGFHIVNGIPSATAIPVATDLQPEASIPTTAQLHVVGRRAAAGDIVLTAGGSPTLGSTLLDFTTLDLEIGDWIKLAGFTTNAVNNGYYRISSIAATSLGLDRTPTGIVTETPAGAVDIFMGERLINGSTVKSFSLEETFNDHSPLTFQYFRGMHVDGYNWTADAQAVVTNQFTFLGFNAFFSDATDPATEESTDGAGRVTGSTTIAVPDFQVLNSSSNVARIARGGTPIAGNNFVLQASLEIANNLRRQNAVGSLGAVGVGVGEFGVTGTLQTYFDDKTLAKQVVDNTETSYDTTFVDDTDHVMLWDLPRIKFSEGAPEVPGKNQDVTINLSYQAILDETLGYTVKLMRFHGVQ